MMTRREILSQAGTLAAVAAGARAAAAQSSSTQGQIKPSVLITMLPRELSYLERFQLAVDIGFRYMEVRTVEQDSEAREIKQAADGPFLAQVFKLGKIDVVEIGELRDRRVRGDHGAGDGLPHPRHLLSANAAVGVGVGRPRRRHALGNLGFSLGLALANVVANVLFDDAAPLAAGAHST